MTRYILLGIVIVLVGAFSAVNSQEIIRVHFLVGAARTHVVTVIFWSALLGFLAGLAVAWPRKRRPAPQPTEEPGEPQAQQPAIDEPQSGGV